MVLGLQKEKGHKAMVFMPFFCYFSGLYIPLYSFLSELFPFDRFGFTTVQAVFILICGCLLLPLLHASILALLMMISKFTDRFYLKIAVFASLFTVGEWVLSLGSLAFPWGSTAISLLGFLPFVQSASIFGQYFITFIVVYACALLAAALTESKKILAVLSLSIFLVNTFSGVILFYFPPEKADTFSAAMIQGNVLSNEKWDSHNYRSIFKKYISMTETAAKSGSDLIILPETAIPSEFVPGCSIHKELAKIAKEFDVTIVSGIHASEGDKNYNSVIAIYPDGSLSQRYDKRHLVPFGEFIPFGDTLGNMFPFIREFEESGSVLEQGTSPCVIATEYGNLGPLVCFDSIFPQFASDAAKDNADILVIVTNDSWFNDSQGIYTHLKHARMRAIETGKPVLRAANTGISASINSKGEIIKSSDPLVEDILRTPMHVSGQTTVYTMTGDVIIYVSAIIIISSILDFIIRRIRHGKNKTLPKTDV